MTKRSREKQPWSSPQLDEIDDVAEVKGLAGGFTDGGIGDFTTS